MEVKTIKQMIEIYGSQRALAEYCKVPPQYLTRWMKMGVIFIDGKPYRPIN